MSVKDIDYIFENIVGGGGKWQWYIMLLTYPIMFASAPPCVLHLFTAYLPDYRCVVPNCDTNLTSITADFLEFSVPKEHSSTEMFTTAKYDPCHVYESKTDSCSNSGFDNSSKETCNAYVYDETIFPETLTTKLDLVCDNESKRRLLSTLMMLGLMIGSLLGGRISDKLGRKKTSIIAILIIIPSVLVGGLTSNYAFYATLRLITCSALPLAWVSMHALILEIFDKNHRQTVIIVKDFLWPISQMILTLIAYNDRRWQNVHFWVGGLGLAALPCLYMIPESPRWCANNGKKDESEQILLNVAKWNGKQLSDSDQEEIQSILNQVDKVSKQSTEKNLNLIDMFKKSNLSKTLIISFSWITTCLGSYTLFLNSTRLHGDLFLNFLLSAIADFPGIIGLVITLKYFSRRLNLFVLQFVTGICCIILAFVPQERPEVILTFFLIGKCSSGAAFTLVWVVTAELYPTNLRSQAVGFSSTVARIFSLLCPFVATLASYWKPLPMLLLGVPGLIAGVLAYFLPEMKGVELPQTMKDTIRTEIEMEPMNAKKDKETL